VTVFRQTPGFRFEVLMVVKMSVLFWVVMPCSLINSYRCSSETFVTTTYKSAWYHNIEDHNQPPQILQKLVIFTLFCVKTNNVESGDSVWRYIVTVCCTNYWSIKKLVNSSTDAVLMYLRDLWNHLSCFMWSIHWKVCPHLL
jgi:hypothetical protein